jgi:tetratricopeptide (TPR) repeat protein
MLLRTLAVVVFSASAGLGQSDSGVIHGRVTDARGQAQHLRVQLLAAGDVPAGDMYTGTEGEFVFQGLPSGEYWVIVEAEGFESVRQPVMLDEHVNPKMQANVVLEPAKSPKPLSPVLSGNASSYTMNARNIQAPVNPQVLREYDRGRTQEGKGNLSAAAHHYRKVLRLEPDYYPALNNLGALYERQGDHRRAEELLATAVGVDPDDGEAYVNLGHSLYEEGRYSEAADRLEEGLKRSPNSAMGHFFLGSADLKLGKIGEAELHLKRACTLDPNGLPAAHLQLANAYLRAHDTIAASAELRTYLQANPADQQAPAIRKLLASMEAPNP